MARQQELLFPDPRPLEDTLGSAFFKTAPPTPGIYLMRDATGTLVYVGKARNLRQRLGNYRIANPDRMPRRTLNLLSCVTRIDLQECSDEADALAAEAQILRTMRPRFNRAGVWPGRPWFVEWTLETASIQVRWTQSPSDLRKTSWGPFRRNVISATQSVVRLLRIVTHPQCDPMSLPAGWWNGILPNPVEIPKSPNHWNEIGELRPRLKSFYHESNEALTEWLRDRFSQPRERAAQKLLELELESLSRFDPTRALLIRSDDGGLLDLEQSTRPTSVGTGVWTI